MRHRPGWNWDTFDAGESLLRSLGHDPVNPAELDRALGITPRPGRLRKEFMHEAMRRDIAALVTCDAIAFLPGWQNSVGARIERKVARWIGLRMFRLDPDKGLFEEEPC